jgi:DNA-binding CsgD family transcriptional regulator
LATFPERWSEWAGTLVEPQQSLYALLRTSTVGVAICDRQLRFQAVNGTLASMNGLPARAHIGKTVHQILGNVGAKIEPAFQHVFETGEPLSNFELTAQLPTRAEKGHWIENYYPIRNKSGRVLQVGVIILEVTKRKGVERALYRLTRQMRQAAQALKPGKGIWRQLHHRTNKRAELLARPYELLENCISQVRIISELLRPPLRLAAGRHHQPVFHPELGKAAPEESLLALDSSSWTGDLNAERLSHRERQVIRFLAEGKSNKEMAVILNISTRTVETYRARMMLKLDLHSIAELARFAVRNNMI